MSGKAFAAFMGVVAVIALLAYGVLTKSASGLEVGDPAPVVELEVLGEPGETRSLADYEGRWVLVNIWASWCNPCRDESPELQAFQEKHGGRDFTLLGIDTQDASDDGLEFVEEFGLTYPSLRDGSGDYAEDLGASGVPESLLVDPEGKVAWFYPGQITGEQLDREVLPLIEGESS